MQKSNGIKVRKLPLPLEIRLGNEPTITDGLFSLTSKEASTIKIIDIDAEKYATVEIYPPTKGKTQYLLTDILSTDTPVGADLSKSRGLGKAYGQYRYFKQPNGNLYVIVEGSRGPRRLQLGNPLDRTSPIATFARAIRQNFNSNEFSKKKLIPFIPKQLSYGQILKGILDVMTFEGYIDKKQGTARGRLRETFKATPKINDIIVTPEQA